MLVRELRYAALGAGDRVRRGRGEDADEYSEELWRRVGARREGRALEDLYMTVEVQFRTGLRGPQSRLRSTGRVASGLHKHNIR